MLAAHEHISFCRAGDILPGDAFEFMIEGVETRPVAYLAVNLTERDSSMFSKKDLFGVDFRDGRILHIQDPEIEVRRIISVKLHCP